jgi:TonB family protein
LSYVVAETMDPSLMSLPSARGFSQPLWGRGAAAAHRPSDWNSKPVYLDAQAPPPFPTLLNPPSLAATAQSSTEKLAPQPEETGDDPSEAPAAVNQSVMRIAGALETRPIVHAPPLSIIANETPLRPTRVRAAVAADGVVRYVVLDRSCGNEAVDTQALELTKQIRFEPWGAADSQPLTWGVIRFLWATEPPPAATNGTANNK